MVSEEKSAKRVTRILIRINSTRVFESLNVLDKLILSLSSATTYANQDHERFFRATSLVAEICAQCATASVRYTAATGQRKRSYEIVDWRRKSWTLVAGERATAFPHTQRTYDTFFDLPHEGPSLVEAKLTFTLLNLGSEGSRH
jgi:hypothetical protein